MFLSSLEPLGFKLVMVGAPLILQVVEGVDVLEHWLVGFNGDTRDLSVLGHCEARADRDWGLHAHRLVDHVFQVVVFS